MSLNLISTAEYLNEVIDCRGLTFSFEFYQLSDKSVIDLSTELVLWVNALLDERFISKRVDMNNKSVTVAKALSQLKDRVGVRWKSDTPL